MLGHVEAAPIPTPRILRQSSRCEHHRSGYHLLYVDARHK